MDKFWMVISSDESQGTRKRHYDIGEAFSEAERLCKQENKPFFLLEATNMCEPERPPVKWKKIE